jgi:hypothetical protein
MTVAVDDYPYASRYRYAADTSNVHVLLRSNLPDANGVRFPRNAPVVDVDIVATRREVIARVRAQSDIALNETSTSDQRRQPRPPPLEQQRDLVGPLHRPPLADSQAARSRFSSHGAVGGATDETRCSFPSTGANAMRVSVRRIQIPAFSTLGYGYGVEVETGEEL